MRHAFQNTHCVEIVSYLGLISPTVYEQLLQMQIPKAPQRLFCAVGIFGRKKICVNRLMKLTPGIELETVVIIFLCKTMRENAVS